MKTIVEDVRVTVFKNGEGLEAKKFVDFEGNQLPDSYLKVHEVNRPDVYIKLNLPFF